MSAGHISLSWSNFDGTSAVVWKARGAPLSEPADHSKGVPGRGSKKPGRVSGATGRGPAQSVNAWASQNLGGQWKSLNPLGSESAGLVLLERCLGSTDRGAVRGTYAVLVAPRVAPKALKEDATVWEPLEFFGGPSDEMRVVQEGPSGHFGRMALLEVDVDVVGNGALSPLETVLGLQDLEFLVVRLSGARGAELHQPLLEAQSAEQDDVLPGTCIACVAIEVSGEKRRTVRHDTPGKFSKLVTVEGQLAQQRQQPADGVVTFRGLSLLVPSEQLRPRAASSAVVDAALGVLRRAGQSDVRVLDLGVGCGALLLGVLHAWGPGASGIGVDIDVGAVRACQTNAARVLDPVQASRAHAVVGDFTKLDDDTLRHHFAPDGYHVVVCNPPYRSKSQQEAYDRASGQSGGYSEQHCTLVAGETGLEFYEGVARCLAQDAQVCGEKALLRRDGALVFQVEAGRNGRAGGMAAIVGAAAQRASGGQLGVCGVHMDDGLERAIVMCLV